MTTYQQAAVVYEAVRDYRRKMLWVVTCLNATEEERAEARDAVRACNEILGDEQRVQ